mmetsp:Transcript_106213/g.298648  ORF Transcript_106213/g.298648 Transcript_106213/m.298648 type:complete len:240 (+) Transcript_106213:799-1518(+)
MVPFLWASSGKNWALALIRWNSASNFSRSSVMTAFLMCVACIARRNVLRVSVRQSSVREMHARKDVLLLPPKPTLNNDVSSLKLYGINARFLPSFSTSAAMTRSNATVEPSPAEDPRGPLLGALSPKSRSLPARSARNIMECGSVALENFPSLKMATAWVRLYDSEAPILALGRHFWASPNAARSSCAEGGSIDFAPSILKPATASKTLNSFRALGSSKSLMPSLVTCTYSNKSFSPVA